MLRINDEAPNFTAESSQGTINFHEWIGTGWAILFSHPKDFTPVCTTELGYMAGLLGEFEKRNCKIIGLSVDPVSDHSRWAGNIEETQGHKVNYPLIGDPQLKVAKLYNMLPAEPARLGQGAQPPITHKVATPVNWKPGDDVIILPTVSDEEAKKKYPGGWKAPRPYLCIVPQPGEEAASGSVA
jgi:alkyl hydroperoxide reductase subunit AhpC